VHELSIAEAMAQLVQGYLQPGDRVLRVRMKAGPLRGIDPGTMQMAWRAIADTPDLRGSTLELEVPPWELQCPLCQRQWSSSSFAVACVCGCREPSFTGGDELLLLSIDVDDAPAELGELRSDEVEAAKECP